MCRFRIPAASPMVLRLASLESNEIVKKKAQRRNVMFWGGPTLRELEAATAARH